jgi:hypothetical protein
MSYGFITTSRAVAPEISGCHFGCTKGAVARRGAIAPGAAHRGAVARRAPHVEHRARGTGGRAPWHRGAGRRVPGAVVPCLKDTLTYLAGQELCYTKISPVNRVSF